MIMINQELFNYSTYNEVGVTIYGVSINPQLDFAFQINTINFQKFKLIFFYEQVLWIFILATLVFGAVHLNI